MARREERIDLDDNDLDLDSDPDEGDDVPDIRLAVLGLVFVVAGIMFLLVPCIIKDDPTLVASGYLVIGALMFALGIVCVCLNIAWCRRSSRLKSTRQESRRSEMVQLRVQEAEEQQGSESAALDVSANQVQVFRRQEVTSPVTSFRRVGSVTEHAHSSRTSASRRLPLSNGAVVAGPGNQGTSPVLHSRQHRPTVVTVDPHARCSSQAHTHRVELIATAVAQIQAARGSTCPTAYLNPTYVTDSAL